MNFDDRPTSKERIAAKYALFLQGCDNNEFCYELHVLFFIETTDAGTKIKCVILSALILLVYMLSDCDF